MDFHQIINECSLGGICGGCFYVQNKPDKEQPSRELAHAEGCSLDGPDSMSKKAGRNESEAGDLRMLDGIAGAAEPRSNPCSALKMSSSREHALAKGISCADQLLRKEQRVRRLLDTACGEDAYGYEGTIESPLLFAYRNKMEYSFGDALKDGPLTLGLHKKRSFYDVIDVDCCNLVHEDCNRIVNAVGQYFRELGLTYNDKRTHLGYLRHLLIRRTVNTGEILIDLVTTSQPLIPVEKHADINETSIYMPESFAGYVPVSAGVDKVSILSDEPVRKKRGRGRRGSDIEIIPGSVRAAEHTAVLSEAAVMEGFVRCIMKLHQEGRLEGTVRGILHTYNDSLSDAVKNDRTDLLFGEDHITEELLSLRFRISPFSFFQTNTKGAEVLYSRVREFIGEELGPKMRVFDLYSGTGTIAQMLAPCAREVIGVEIIEEAVEAARENARLNGLSNCRFVADDVLHALDTLEAPDLIVLDPPRDGVNAKALQKIIGYGVKNMVYVSCKPESLARDLEMLQYAGYRVVRSAAVDQFPWTDNIETIVLLSK